jgi:hypothetical protein
MDEQRLSELFRDATGEAPPPSFDRDDVVAASRRATARGRSALAGGSLLGVAVLTGGVLLGGQVLQRPPTSEPPAAASELAPGTGDRMLEPVMPFAAPPGAGPDAPGPDAPAGAAGGCGPADTELTATLNGALTGTAGTGPGLAFPRPCPPGFRAAGVAVPGGTLYAVLGPVAVSDADLPGYASAPAGAEVLSVISVPSNLTAPPPRAADVDDLARELADRFQ